jgi:hypothetical protein
LRIDTIRLATGDNAPLRMTEDVKAGDSKRVIAGGLIASLLGSLSRFPFAHEHTGKRRCDSCRNRSHRIFERRCLVGSVKVPRSSRCCPRRREPSESRWIQMKTGRSSCALFLIFRLRRCPGSSRQQPRRLPRRLQFRKAAEVLRRLSKHCTTSLAAVRTFTTGGGRKGGRKP